MRAAKLSYFLVTLPLLATPMGVVAAKPAFAAGAAEEAVRILAKARSTDAKCNFLSASERQELSRYTSRAERAAGGGASASQAGAEEGRAQECTPDASADVRETLSVAREVMASAPGADAATPPPQRQRMRAEPASTAPDRPMPRGLSFYSRVVRAFYLERQCRSLPRADAGIFWERVRDIHRATLNPGNRQAMASAMAEAERAAAASSCSSADRARIEKVYAEVSSR